MSQEQHKFIQQAIKHRGELRAFAERKGTINRQGNIDLDKTQKALDNSFAFDPERKLHLQRALNLAYTLKKIPHKYPHLRESAFQTAAERMESQ